MKKAQDIYGSRVIGMYINPFLNDGEYVVSYKEEIDGCLAGIDDFNVSDLHFDNYMRYCALVFDPNSPAVVDYPELKVRKEKIKSMLGYMGREDRRFEVRLIVRVYQNKQFTYLTTIQNVFDDYAEKANMVLEGLDEDKLMKTTQLKTKLINDMGDLLDKERQAMSSMFFGDKDMVEDFKKARKTTETVAKMGK